MRWPFVVAFVAGAFLLGSCAHDPFAGQCLDPQTSARTLVEMEKLVDHETHARHGTSELVEDACTRRKYVRGDHRIVLFKRPGRPPTEVQASMVERRDNAVPPEACLREAEKTFERLGFPQLQTLVARVRAKEDWRWLDPDIGPSKWLECTPRQGQRYYERLQTFLHELNHDANEGTCLYAVAERTRRCFWGVSELPLARFARMRPKMPTAATQELVDWTLDHYLSPQSTTTILTLFEQVNAYTSGTTVRVAAAEKEGKQTIFDERGQREMNLLPLFLAQTAEYLTKLRATQPDLYKRICGMAKENNANGVALFDAADKAFEAWRKVAAPLKGTPDGIARAENELYAHYRKLRTALAEGK